MKKLFFTLVLAIVSSVWVMSEAQCLVPATEQEGPFVEELTGLLCLDAYPCPYEENCPTCLTMVLRTKEKKYYLTGSVMESIDAPTDKSYVKVVVSGITGSTDLGDNMYYNWLKVETLRYSEEPVTTNIQTHGYVDDESGTRLEGIRVIVHTADRTVSDTVYTHKEGEFVSTIKGIVYPVDSMYVTVSDVSGRFKEQTKSTTYTYECGVEFNPETDTGLNSKELLFVLQEKEKSASLPSLCDEWHMLEPAFSLPGEDYLYTERLTTDTIIAEHYYIKLEKEDQKGTTYKGALREEGERVYYIPAGSTHEYLLYDFTAEEGDTLTNLWIGGDEIHYELGLIRDIIVEKIEGTAPSRKFYASFIYEYWQGGFVWIEGVGLNEGPAGWSFVPGTPVDPTPGILCAYKDGEQVYTSELGEKYGCSYTKTPSSERWCMPQMATREGKITRIGGPLREESTPCYESEEEPCLPCLTVALRAGGTTYYLVSGDAQVIATLDTLSAGAPVIVDGVAFKEDKYTYLQVCHIEPVIVSEFQKRLMGNWQVYKPVPDLDEEGANDVSWWNIDATTIDEQGFSTDNWGPRPTYSLHEQEDGTWLMTVYNLYQSSCQSEESWLTITIHKLTEDRMEWEYDSHYEYLWRYPHKEDPDTIPMYIKDGPGTSTVEPVDPNQIIVTLNGDKLTIHEYLGIEIGYVLTKAPSGNNMPARGKEMADDTFSESVSIQLTESGLYTLTLTSPEWSYSIVGTFEYDAPQGIESIETVPAAQKILRDGQLLIQKGDRTYTVQGIELHE